MTVYLIGPSEGYLDGNYQAFQQAALALRERGAEVLMATEGIAPGEPLRAADAVVVMEGWASDPAAAKVVEVARYLKTPIYRLPDLAPL
jgi:hypothetical protein